MRPEDFTAKDGNALDVMRAYIHYTLCANWYYSRLPDNYALSTDKNVERAYACARYYDTLAVSWRKLLNDDQWRVCCEQYAATFKLHRTPFNYPFPLNISKSVPDLWAQYPTETYESFCDINGETYSPEYGWL